MLLKNVRDKLATVLTAALFLLIPLDYVLPHSGNATVVTITSIVIIVYGLFYVLNKKSGKILFSHGSASLIIMLIVFLLSFVWAINQNLVFSRFVSVANTFLLYIFIVQFRYDKDSIEVIENASLLGALILVIWVFNNINLDLVYAGYRLKFSKLGSEFFSDPNGLGGRIMLPLIIAVNRVFYCKKKILILFYSALIAAFAYILFLTGSRAGIVAIAAASIAFLFQGFEKKKKWVLIGFALLLLLFFFAPNILPEHITARIFDMNSYREVTKEGGDRIDIWKHVVFDLFFSSPLFGYGGGCSGNALAQFYGHVKAVHNSYLMVLCETGLLGFVPWMYFIIRQIREAVSLRKFSTVLLPATIAVLIVAMTLDAFSEKYLWSIFYYIHIISFCYLNKAPEQSNNGDSINH